MAANEDGCRVTISFRNYISSLKQLFLLRTSPSPPLILPSPSSSPFLKPSSSPSRPPPPRPNLHLFFTASFTFYPNSSHIPSLTPPPRTTLPSPRFPTMQPPNAAQPLPHHRHHTTQPSPPLPTRLNPDHLFPHDSTLSTSSHITQTPPLYPTQPNPFLHLSPLPSS
ncbi:hypothetical protein Pmani_022092 [Petrolisthes manimaculis]|uniref:Uncharacterized protein n=1 Tax=Petrolisthes manimaculis TaxID=1843537 RepID=A0AAE1U4S1_9EUCA|nr:hypothetical protein Pmani_022092 [Petrolisthes manimaculis]